MIQGGNQECGVILKTSDEKEIKYIQEWFREWLGKNPPHRKNGYSKELTLLTRKEKKEIYALAIRENKAIKLFINIPEAKSNKLGIWVNGRNCLCQKLWRGFIQ